MENSKQDLYGMKYDSRRRFASYWHQIREVLERRPANLLEIGVGSGFVNRYLRDREILVTSVDSDASLKPDIVGDVRRLEFADNTYDTSIAYEVLEHIPYQDSLKAIGELGRVSQKYVLVSLPDATRVLCLAISLPGIGIVRKLLSIPIFPRVHIMTKGGHYWEIGKRGYSLSRVKRDIENNGLTIEKTYRVFENPYHRFFILKKIIS